MPAGITDRSGRVIPLLDWHKDGALKAEAEKLLVRTRAAIAGAARPTMGMVSADSGAT